MHCRIGGSAIFLITILHVGGNVKFGSCSCSLYDQFFASYGPQNLPFCGDSGPFWP